MTTENRMGCPQTDRVERERYAGALSTGSSNDRESNGASDLMERIRDRDNLNHAYKQVKRNHSAPGMDGMTVEAARPWLKEHKEELLQQLREG